MHNLNPRAEIGLGSIFEVQLQVKKPLVTFNYFINIIIINHSNRKSLITISITVTGSLQVRGKADSCFTTLNTYEARMALGSDNFMYTACFRDHKS